MAFQRGDVVLVPFPFTDRSTTKTRPAVIVSNKEYHCSTRDYIMLEITASVTSPLPPNIRHLQDWQQAGLKRQSFAKAVLFTIEETQIALRIGCLTANDLASVDTLLRNTLF